MQNRSEISNEVLRQSSAGLIFVKLRKMIASDTQPTDTILGAIAVAAHSLTGATGAAVAMPRDGAVVCVGRSGESAPELGARLNVDSGISGECLRTGVIMRCDDASRDFHVDAEVCRQLGLQSIAVVPLRGQYGRVGVLEAFSTESYAFTEDKMEVLGRLAGIAEAAWARGAIREIGLPEVPPEGFAVAAGAQEAVVESPTEEVSAISDAVPLAEVREILSPELPSTSPVPRKWNYAILAAVAVVAVVLLSVYGWRAWYRSSVESAASRSGLPPAVSPENTGAPTELTPMTDTMRPSSHPAATGQGKSGLQGTAVARPPRPASKKSRGTRSDPVPSGEDAPQLAASNADPADLGRALATTPALPQLGAPISQGVTGGVLLHKVQPIYPAEARRMRVQGSVVIDATVTAQGQVDGLKLVSGDPLLAPAAMDAVRRWRYTPYSLNGQPIAKETRITISFIAPQ